MSQTGTSAWWADVQHLRDAAERTDEARRRADQADLAARRERRERSQVDAEVAPVRRLESDAPAPRRRDHADAAAPRRADVPAAPRRGGYGNAVALPGRRTVEIRGRTVPAPAVPRSTELDRNRRPPRRAVERVGSRPDRMAMWALMMGLVLILVALSTSSPT